MTDAPKRIWAYKWHQYETRNGPSQTEYIRADIHDALVKAADELAEAAREDLNAWPSTLVEGSSLGIALAAYRKSKENTK